MSNHPNFDRTQAALDAVRQGDYGPNFDLYTDDIVLGKWPWRRILAPRPRQGRPGAHAHGVGDVFG